MTDSMKFGPEWLRNLSSEGTTSGVPKCQLAVHRYGREEMLALFDEKVKAPETLVKLQGLYVEETQTPMALLTMTEEEDRQWNKGINSDTVLRLANKTLPGPPGGGGIRGRGGSIDRGRGRPRGSGGFHYSRGLSYEEQADGIKEGGPPDRGFSRSIRSYDRSQGPERSWGERNGGAPGDWNGSTSPRKEYSMKDFSGGGRNSTESWRRHRGSSEEEEVPGWRRIGEKWGRSNSWRDETDEGGILSKSTSRPSTWGRGWADEGLRGRSHDEDSLASKRNYFVDEVPEWAMENPSESGGSFDATGAFHGGSYSDEEEEHSGARNARNRLSEDLDLQNKSKSPPRVTKPSRNDFNDYDDDYEEPNSSPKDRKLSRSQTAQGNLSTEPGKNSTNSLSKSQSSANVKTETEGNTAGVPSKRTESQSFDRIRVQHQNFIDKNGTNKEQISDDGGEVNDKIKEDGNEPVAVSEEVIKSETSAVLKTGVSNIEKNSSLGKENSTGAGMRLPEDLDRGVPVNRQGSEEDMEGMAEVVKDTVVKLFEDEEKPPVNVDNDKWYYRDPQGVVQGPFRSSEMLEWFMNGYFALSLLVRREQDELYVKLGDLMGKCGKIPFLPGVNLPVLKADAELPQQPPPTPVQPQPHGLSQPDIFMQQYHQYRILQKQFLMSQQLALNKLSQSEMWNTLSPVQQRSLLMQKLALAQQAPLTIDQLAQVDKNPLSQLIAQMQQNKMPMPEVRDTKSMDPVRQLLQHMNVMQASQPPLVSPLNPAGVMLNPHLNPQSHLNSVLTNTGLNPTPNLGVEEPKVEDPIQSLLRQLGNQSNIMPTPPAPAPTDSLWGAPGRPQHWAQPNPPVGNAGGLPLWEIKTEQQILAEQQLRLEEERRQEEMRKRKEEEEEVAKKQKELEEKRREEEKREEMKKLELKRAEEEKQRQQLLKEKEKEEKKKAEEMKKKQQEETQKKKQEVAKKMQEAQKKKEEKEKKKEEEREKKRLLEEGKKKLENEKKKKEEEQQRLKKKQEEEEAAKKEERMKRPIDTLKKMQEMQMERFKKPLPWSQPAVAATGASLSDIQKLQEKEKKQQQQAQMLAQQKEMQQQMQNETRSNGMNLKWAEQMPKVNPSVKSVAEIQAEEQLQLAKQLEKERLEREKQQREAALTSSTGIWGNASQSLTWSSSSSAWGVPPVQNNPTPGFWDEVAPAAAKNKAKVPTSPLKGKPQQATNPKPTALSGANQKNSKPKSKKEEAAVMKLFERLGDEFTSWCSASLQSIQSDVDIPTFVSFLRDIESPYEVTEYVKCYLGDGKEAQEFAKQFLERRSRWMSAQKANSGDEDRISLSQSNTGSQLQAQEFQEVKGKGKKSKKGKMLKVDNRILGFSVTAAPDRINIESESIRINIRSDDDRKRNKILAERNVVYFTKLAHQFWFSTSYAPPGSGSGRGQTEDEKKEKKEQAEAVARAEIAFQAAQQQRIQQRAEREQREFEREVREQTEYLQQRERDLIHQQRECRSASLQSICRAPIASLDCMEEFTGTNEHLTMHMAPTKEALLSGYHSQTPLGSAANPIGRQGSVTPGLRYRNLGKSGLRVSNIGLGTWVTLGSNLTEEQAEDVIALAYESGINVFDLSEAYSGPKAEIELGKILARRGWKRSSYVVTTKIYWNSKSDERGLSRKHILECVKASLQRLNLEYIDIIILHKADPMCPMEEIVRAMNHVISQGWALYWGTARWSMVEVMEAYTNCRTFNCVTPICEQSEYHMFCREKTELYMPELYNKIGVGLMAWAPLTMGLISGKIEDGALPLVIRSSLKNKYSSFSWAEDESTNKECTTWLRERLQPDEIRKQQEKIRDISLMAEKLGCTLTQLSIAWCLKNESVQCLLLGATTVDQLYENIQSLQLIPKLNTNLMTELERILENKPTRPPIVSTLALR